ncbi:MAG: Na+/H+ antiporter NhaC family protein [Oscillospiraceae bacterium]|nr:Na+/H+ antiporter NhaC family protein [Oscillospiraceae bacterium]
MDYGWLSILPPVIAMGFVLITKEVLFSLTIGIFSGSLIYNRYNLLSGLETTFRIISGGLAGNSEKVNILVFLGFLGALVAVLTITGGAQAYGDWAAKKIKTKKGSLLMICLCGALFCIDDYFHFLAAGVIMKPVTERNKVSPEKFAYFLDSTGSPFSVISPLSGWAAVIVSLLGQCGVVAPMNVFVKGIPYNLYAVLTVVVVVIFSVVRFDLGQMAACEKKQEKLERVVPTEKLSEEENSIDNKNGKIIHMIVPITLLIGGSILYMLKFGGYFSGQVSVLQALENTKMGEALVMGSFLSLFSVFLLTVPLKLMSLQEFVSGVVSGIKAMLPSVLILILAWAISDVCSKEYLNTGLFAEKVLGSAIPVYLFPVLVFVFACLLSFATGTSWGTFGIILPVVVSLCNNLPGDILTISVSATLAGAVFGDHVSPLSETTVMAATSADCNLIKHVSTQLPYAIIVAVSAAVGYFVAGLSENIFLVLMAGVAMVIVTIYFARKLLAKFEKEEKILA